MASLFDLSFDDPTLQPSFGNNADLASLLSEINAKIEQPIPGIVTMATPSKNPRIPSPSFDEEFKFDGLENLLAAQPREYGPQDTRVSVFEKFDLSKIPDEQLFPTIDSYRMSIYINKVSPPKPTIMKSVQTVKSVNKENDPSNIPSKVTKQPPKVEKQSEPVNTKPIVKVPEKPVEAPKAVAPPSKIPTPPLSSSPTKIPSNPSSATSSPARQSLSGIPSKKTQKTSSLAAPMKQTASLNSTAPPKTLVTSSKSSSSTNLVPQKKASVKQALPTKEAPKDSTRRGSISKPPASKKSPPRSESLFTTAHSPLSIDEFLKNADSILSTEPERIEISTDQRVLQLESQVKELQIKNEAYERRIERLEKILGSKGFLE